MCCGKKKKKKKRKKRKNNNKRRKHGHLEKEGEVQQMTLTKGACRLRLVAQLPSL